MKTTLTSRKYRPQGFSLAEVTLALAIAAFGITTVLSLLPQGLSNMRKAGDVAAASRISQHILETAAADTIYLQDYDRILAAYDSYLKHRHAGRQPPQVAVVR